MESFDFPENPHQYEIENKIGEGTFASVYICKHSSGMKYAAKKMHWSMLKLQKLDKYIYNEIHIMKEISRGHSNLLQLIDYYYEQHYLYLIMELLEGGELMDKLLELQHFDEGHAKLIFKQVLSGVSYLHDHCIVHRDIKPENIVFRYKDKLDVVLVDFGLAVHLDPLERPTLSSPAGSKGFVAPEILLGDPYNEAVDLWSIGVTTYFVLCGYTPFENLEKDEGLDEHLRIMSGNYRFNKGDWDSVSLEAKDFIRHLLCVDPEKRLTAKQAMKHHWLANVSTLGRETTEATVTFHLFRAPIFFQTYMAIYPDLRLWLMPYSLFKKCIMYY
eukprot:NODE_252_length_11723_cov_1.965933.p5 type:complete len:330 gc:universal NODE_252_length_11723_cov_1.965933:2027-3016(+)